MNMFFIFLFMCSTLWAQHHIPWTQEKTEIADIWLEKAGPGEIRNTITVPGRIIFHPDRVAYVIPKVGGVASSICKNLGDCVEKGDVLVVLESREMAEAKSQYLGALKRWDLKCILLKKEESLKGISPEQDYLNTRLETEEARLNVDLAKQTLYSLGLTEEDIRRIEGEKPIDLRFYQIRSPIYGKVLQRNLTLGELVTNSTKIFTIANFDQVWVEISVNQQDVPYLKENLEIDVFTSDGKHERAKLYQFNPAIHEETRRATAIAVLNNPDDIWKTGEFVTVNIITEVTDAQVVVPKSAIQTIHDENIVFVQQEHDFEAREVILGKMDENNVEILSGLNHGEIYAASNTFVIKAEMEKEDAEHSH